MKEIFVQYIGNWGKYQVFVYIICFVPFMLTGSLTQVSTFTAGVPNTRCYVPGYDDNGADYNTPFNHSNYVAQYLFPSATTDSDAQVYCSYCNASFIGKENCTKANATKCIRYIYDTSQFHESLVSLFDMVCDNVWMAELLQSLYMVGVFFGGGIFGLLGDKFGRRRSFLIAGTLQIVVCNAVPFATNYYVYCIFQVLVGALQEGTFLCAFIIVMELFGGLPKTIFGIWIQGVYAVGYIYVGVAAYFIRDWRWLTWSISFLTVYYIPMIWIFPESFRWLVVNGKTKEANKLITKAAKCNNVTLPPSISTKLTYEKNEHGSLLSLFKDRRMTAVTLIVFFTWMVTSLSYYGLSWNTSSLPGNVYLNFVISGLVELPAYAICVPLMENCGRRISLIGFLLVGGVACIVSGFTSQKYLTLGLTFLGKLCVSASKAITYNYTAEIFPTVVRNSATGFSSLMARIGSISAPQIALLKYYVNNWLPVVIFGSSGVMAAALDWFLPETKGKWMPETMDDGLNIAKQLR